MGFLHGKRALIIGIASRQSIAWGVANAMHREGAQLAFTYSDERLEDRADEAANAFGSNIVLPCNLAEDAQIDALFAALSAHWDGLDILVHSIGFGAGDTPQSGSLDELTRADFAAAHDIYSYSLTALAKAARSLMTGRSGAVLTVTGPAFDNCTVAGLARASLEASVRYLAGSLGPETTRVNAVSAGPIRTIAAGAMNSHATLDHVEKHAPLRRSVTIDEVGNVGAFLCSDLAAGITGEIVHVDAGYNILGMAGV